MFELRLYGPLGCVASVFLFVVFRVMKVQVVGCSPENWIDGGRQGAQRCVL